jgi:hypothetical protein
MRQVRRLHMSLTSSNIPLSGLPVVPGSRRPNYTLQSSGSRRTLLRTSKGPALKSSITFTMRSRFVEGPYAEEAILIH